jgi:hypothetical protein
MNVKFVADEAVPPGFTKVITPVVPDPTVTVILVAVLAVIVAGVPPMVTEVAPLRFVPVIVTVAPLAPVAGVNDVMVGAGMNVKFVADEEVPPGFTKVITPVVPDPTVTVILVAVLAVIVAGVPPIVTEVAPLRLVPVIVTVAPLAPVVGVNDVMVGAGMNANPAEEAVPPGVVTLTLPEAPAPTTAVMVVADTTV